MRAASMVCCSFEVKNGQKSGQGLGFFGVVRSILSERAYRGQTSRTDTSPVPRHLAASLGGRLCRAVNHLNGRQARSSTGDLLSPQVSLRRIPSAAPGQLTARFAKGRRLGGGLALEAFLYRLGLLPRLSCMRNGTEPIGGQGLLADEIECQPTRFPVALHLGPVKDNALGHGRLGVGPDLDGFRPLDFA